MANLEPALIVTLLGMSIIFLVLGILWLTVFVLDKVFPFKAPSAQAGAAPPPTADDTQTVAVIQAALTAYRKQR